VRGVYEWKLSEKSKKANAALTGLGNTRRIILADTLLENYTPDEIEAVLAHELGHHVHRHILKSIAVQVGTTLLGFLGGECGAAIRHRAAADVRTLADFASCRCWRWWRRYCHSWLMPALNAYSRLQRAPGRPLRLGRGGQRRALRRGNEQAGSPEPGERAPSRVVEVLFHISSAGHQTD